MSLIALNARFMRWHLYVLIVAAGSLATGWKRGIGFSVAPIVRIGRGSAKCKIELEFGRAIAGDGAANSE